MAAMDYEAFFKSGSTRCIARGAIAFSPISSGVAAGFRAPSTTASAPKSRCGARTIISAWGSIRRCSRRWRRRCARPAPAPAAPATSPAPASARAAGARARRSARARGGAGLHLGLCRQRGGAVDPGGQHARHGRAVGCDEPCLDDRRHPQQPRREAHLPPQRPGSSGRVARRIAGRAAEAGLLRIGLFDGWRHRADRRDCAMSPTASAR